MASQIVMDHTGDTRHQFDAADVKPFIKRRSASGRLPRWASPRRYAPLPGRSR
jgi:hypothetical protein